MDEEEEDRRRNEEERRKKSSGGLASATLTVPLSGREVLILVIHFYFWQISTY